MDRTHLNNRKAQHRRRNIANPHARKHGDKHIRQQYSAWLRAGFTQHKRRHHLRNVVLRQGRGDGEAAKQQHNHGRPHGREDVAGGVLGVEAVVGCVVADDGKGDGEEGDEQGGYEEGDGLGVLLVKW